MRDDTSTEGWTAFRATVFIGIGSAALWALIIFGLVRLF